MQSAPPQILTDVMNSLQRFFKVGLYYPEGHTVANQAAATFLRALNKVTGKEGSALRFGVSETTLSLQGVELDNSLFAVQYFHDLLHSLNISTLDIERDITSDQLRQFLTRLLVLQTKVRSSLDFQSIEITGLPSTVTIHQLNFLVNQSSADGEGSGYSFQPTIDFLLSTFVDNGLNQEQIAMCRKLLESIPDALRKRSFTESDLPAVTWDDVEKLLRGIAESHHSPGQDSQTLLLDRQQNIDALVAILTSIEGGIGGSKSRDAVTLLVNALQGARPQGQEEEKKAPECMRAHDAPGITINELQLALEPFKARPLPADLGENNRSEELSILIHMLGQEQRPSTTMTKQEALHACLGAPLANREWRVVIQGMQHLLKTMAYDRVEMILLPILKILRRSQHTTPLIFLRDLCQGLTKAEFVSCWPLLINEALITGPQNEPKLFREICALTGLLSRQEVHSNFPRLERLDALREKCIATAIFSPPPAALHDLLLLLLNSSQASYIYEQLTLGLRRQPLGWLDKAVAPLLDSTLPSHQQFIADLLKEKDPEQPSPALKKIGASIIVERLPAMPAESQAVIQAMQLVLKTLDPERLDAGLAKILGTLRHSPHTPPLSFLRDFCQGLTKAEFLTCWPFLVNEALIAGPEDEPELFQEICAQIDLLPYQEMASHLARIEGLDALREQRIAPTLFSPPPAALHDLLLLLLKAAQAPYIAKQLILGLRRQSFGWLDRGVAPLLDSSWPSHQQFLRALLKEEHAEQPSPELQKNGAMIIVKRLAALPAEQRHAEWLSDTFAVLAQVPIPDGRDMLDTIIRSRHWLIIPVWPKATRQAARKALREMF